MIRVSNDNFLISDLIRFEFQLGFQRRKRFFSKGKCRSFFLRMHVRVTCGTLFDILLYISLSLSYLFVENFHFDKSWNGSRRKINRPFGPITKEKKRAFTQHCDHDITREIQQRGFARNFSQDAGQASKTGFFSLMAHDDDYDANDNDVGPKGVKGGRRRGMRKKREEKKEGRKKKRRKKRRNHRGE